MPHPSEPAPPAPPTAITPEDAQELIQVIRSLTTPEALDHAEIDLLMNHLGEAIEVARARHLSWRAIYARIKEQYPTLSYASIRSGYDRWSKKKQEAPSPKPRRTGSRKV